MTRSRAVFAIVLALLLVALATRLDLIADPIPKLAGTLAWTTSRAAGVIAFGALTLDVVFGMFVTTGLFDRWIPRGASIDVHRWLASVALALVGLHVAALLVDPAIHFDAIDVLAPGAASYRPVALGLGIVALYGMVIIQASFGWRKQLGVRAWRMIHSTAFLVYLGTVTHGLSAGSDAAHRGMQVVYASSCAIVLALVAVRLIAWRLAKRYASHA